MIVGQLWHSLSRFPSRLPTHSGKRFVFVHINKTGGSSVERALGIPFRHKTARELRDELGKGRWERRFSFAFVRNPWDKVASHYYYRVKTNQTGLGDRHLSFNDWVRETYGRHTPRYYNEPKMFMPQMDWLTDGEGAVIVDFIGRFEVLEKDFLEVCRRIGQEVVCLPHVKSSQKPAYREIYEPDTAKIVRSWFQEDIERFGYEL